MPYFPSTISYLPKIADILSPPSSATTSRTPISPHHPLLSGQDSWEIRAVLLLWLGLLLTVPFDLAALDDDDAKGDQPSLDATARNLLFSSSASSTARQIISILLPLLHMPGKEGSYAALALARLLSRSDGATELDGLFEWASRELSEGEREGEANFVASLLQFLAVLPGLLPHDHSYKLGKFTDKVLFPHLRGGRTTAGSGLIRKLAVKAKGRWWIAELSRRQQGECGVMPIS